MHALILYESMFGNTRAIADAIADGLRDAGSAEVAVMAAPEASPDEVEAAALLVVGGPTHVHGMASARSLKAAQADAVKHDRPDPALTEPVIRDWFETIVPGGGRRAAAFDTRIGKPKLITGSAAHGVADRLRRHGYDVVAEDSFIVDGTAGPLHEGELDRARAWGSSLASQVEVAAALPE
jgi:hypothetical protein